MAEKNNHRAPAEKPAEKPADKSPENPRKAIREARAARLRVIEGPPRTVKVYAANEALRGSLRHANGTRFRSSLDQAAEWPNDSFTARRIADGSVLLDGPGTAERAEPDPNQNARQHAAACKPKPAESKPAEPKAEETKPDEETNSSKASQSEPQPAA
jgi:hypothetical protein